MILAAAFMVVTSGFTVFHHSCQSMSTSEYSVLIPEFSCNHYNAEKSHGMPACCHSAEDASHQDHPDDDCCDTESYVVKIDFTVKMQDALTFCFENSATSFELIEYASLNEDDQSQVDLFSNDLSPPKAGRDLHIFLQQLNIPDPAV